MAASGCRPHAAAPRGSRPTYGLIPLDGVYPLASSLDTIGPMTRDVAGLMVGMQLLETGFTATLSPPTSVGRFRLAGTDPVTDHAVDDALVRAELHVVPIELPGWVEAADAFVTTIATVNRDLVDAHTEAIGEPATSILVLAAMFTPDQVAQARTAQERWKDALRAVSDRVETITLPTLACFPPPIAGSEVLDTIVQLAAATAVVNLARLPAIALPIPAPDGPGLSASVRLVGPPRGEDRLLSLGAHIEDAVTS